MANNEKVLLDRDDVSILVATIKRLRERNAELAELLIARNAEIAQLRGLVRNEARVSANVHRSEYTN